MNKSLLLISVMILALGAWFFLLQEHTGVALDWVRDKGPMGAVVAGLVYALATVLMIPGSAATLAFQRLDCCHYTNDRISHFHSW